MLSLSFGLSSIPSTQGVVWAVSLTGWMAFFTALLLPVDRVPWRGVGARALQTDSGGLEQRATERTIVLQRQTERLTELTTLIQTVTAPLDTPRVFQAVVEGTLQLLHVSMARLWVVDPFTGDAVIGATVAAPDLIKNAEEFPTRLPKGEGAVWWTMTHRKARYTPVLAEDPIMDGGGRWFKPAGLVSSLAVPLLRADEALGALILFTSEPREFTEEEQKLLWTFAGAAALSIEKARLHEETQQRLRQTETLLAVSQAVGSTLEVAEVARRTAREMVKALDADMGGAWQLSPDRDFLIPIAGYHVPPALLDTLSSVQQAVGSRLVEVAKAIDGPLYAEDSRNDPNFDHPLLGLVPHKSVLVFPMRVKDEIIGGFGLVWVKQPHTFTAEELGLAEAMVRQAAIAIENARLLKAEREAREQLALSETQYRELFENVIDIVYLHDMEGRFLAVNGAAARASGYTREEFLQMNIAQLLVPEDLARNQTIIHRMIAGKQPTEFFTAEFIMKGGSRAILECSGRLVFKDGVPVAVQGVARDITLRRKLEDGQAAFVEVVKELAVAKDFDRIFSLIGERVCRHLATESAYLLLIEGEELVLRGSYGFENPQGMTLRPKISESQAGHVVMTRAPQACADMTGDPEWRDCSVVTQLGYRAILQVPVLLRGEVIGVLAVLQKSPRIFPSEDTAFLVSLAGHTAVAFDRTNLVRELETHLKETQTLLSVSQTVSSTLDLTEAMRRVARETARAIGADMVGAYLADPDQESLRPIAGYRVPKPLLEQFVNFSIPLKDHPALEEAWQHQRPVYSTDAQSDPRINLEAIQRFPQRSVLFFPMVVKGEPIGGLFVTWWEQEHQFTPEELRLVEGISRQAAIAIENARLYEQHRQMVERLRLFAQSLRSIGESVVITDLAGKIIFINEAFTRIHGWTEDEVLGQPMFLFPIREHRREIVAATWEGGWHGELRARRKSDEEFPIFLTTAPVFNDEGQPVAIVGVARDLSQEKLLQAQLIQAEKLATTGQLAAGVAHEINNPLTVILGNASLVVKKAESKEIREDLETIQAEALRAAKIVRDLLTFARPAPDEKTPLDLNDVLKQTLGLQSYHLSTDNIEVIWNLTMPLPKILGDQSQLQQVILNLVVNAHQAIKGAHDRGTLWIETDADNGCVWAKIRDDGPGISRELLPRIFDPFLTTKPVGQGTGLGLSVSYGIVQAHGGQLAVQSNIGHGATFTLTLPAIKSVEPQETAGVLDPALRPSG